MPSGHFHKKQAFSINDLDVKNNYLILKKSFILSVFHTKDRKTKINAPLNLRKEYNGFRGFGPQSKKIEHQNT